MPSSCALLRYRRIPFDWVIMTKALREATEHLRPNLIPVLQYHDGTYRGETTTLAFRSCPDACSNSGRANSFGKWTAGLRGDKDRWPVSYRQSGPARSNETARCR